MKSQYPHQNKSNNQRNYKGERCLKCNVPITTGSKTGVCRKHIVLKKRVNTENYRTSKIGSRNPNYGKKPSLESRTKQSLKMRGELNPSWKGGKNTLNKRLRHSYKFSDWRGKIFERDKYTCQHCKNVGGILHPHHIKYLSTILYEYNINTLEEAYECKELWDINNGITLCKKCHKEIHKNEITVPDTHAFTRNHSSRQPQISSNKSRKKVRKDSTSLVGNCSKGLCKAI